MSAVEVLVITPSSDLDLRLISGVDPAVHVVDAGGLFDDEIRATWSAWAVNRYLGHRTSSPSTPDERDALLASAEVILGGWPFPLDIRGRAPRLRWFHQRPAGASNLLRGDLWGSDVVVTTSRGYGNTRPMAEYVLGCFLCFARGLHRAPIDQRERAFDHRAYQPVSLAGKTACVIGVGGIGTTVGELCAGVGMRVVGTRRQAVAHDELPPGFSRVAGAAELHSLLRESGFVAVCCPWTQDTTNLIGREALDAMPQGSVLVNVARGEIVDEAALVEALAAGRLRGVALDVYTGEFEHGPDPRLWQDERVLITPHVSGGTD
jgi:phosphoglycerate dehydrogenase-like enzyme